jgi:hypothetical protein
MKNKAYENNLTNIKILKQFLLTNCSLSNRIQRIFHTMDTPVYIICKNQINNVIVFLNKVLG